MDITTMYVAESIYRERLGQAEQTRQWAQHAVTIHFGDRVRQTISDRLITWGEQLRVSDLPIETRS
jgi:hypothetical protein